MIQDIIREFHEQVLLEVLQEQIQQSHTDYKVVCDDFKQLLKTEIEARHKLINQFMNKEKSAQDVSYRDIILFNRILSLNQARQDKIEILKSLEDENGPYEEVEKDKDFTIEEWLLEIFAMEEMGNDLGCIQVNMPQPKVTPSDDSAWQVMAPKHKFIIKHD